MQLLLRKFIGVIDAVESRPIPENSCAATSITAIFAIRAMIMERDSAALDDHTVNPQKLWAEFRHKGVANLAQENGITLEKNRGLFRTPVLNRTIALVLTAISWLRARGAAETHA